MLKVGDPVVRTGDFSGIRRAGVGVLRREERGRCFHLSVSTSFESCGMRDLHPVHPVQVGRSRFAFALNMTLGSASYSCLGKYVRNLCLVPV